jgi:hypothetical protein
VSGYKKVGNLEKENILQKITYSLQLEELYNDKLNYLRQIKPSNEIEKRKKLKEQEMYFDLLKIEQQRIKELKKHIK